MYASYPWAAWALVLADGSAHYTALPGVSSSTVFRPGKEAASSGYLRTNQDTKGQYGINAAYDSFDLATCLTLGSSGVAAYSDVLLRRILS